MADGITDEMIDKAARAHAEHEGYDWTEVSEFWQRRYLGVARIILESTLAGRTVVDLPAPEIRPRKQRSWFVASYEITAHVAYTGDAMVDDDDRIMSAGHAEDHGLALIAAAREARQLAIEVADEASADVAGGGVL